VSSAEEVTVPANGKALISTQLSIAVPLGTYGRVAPRSGLGVLILSLVHTCPDEKISAVKFMIHTGAGVIDADYRGQVFVLLFNLSDKDFQGSSSCNVDKRQC
jgi:dUTP pyrophosphatase